MPDSASASRVSAYLSTLDLEASEAFTRSALRQATFLLRRWGAGVRTEPEDVVNIAIIKVLEGRYPWDPVSSPDFARFFRTVMWGVVGNLQDATTNEHQHLDDRVIVTHDHPEEEDVAAGPTVVATANANVDPAVAAETQSDLEHLCLQLKRVDPLLEQLYLLVRHGFTANQIAEFLGLPLTAVRALRKRLDRVLKSLIPDSGFPPSCKGG